MLPLAGTGSACCISLPDAGGTLQVNMVAVKRTKRTERSGAERSGAKRSGAEWSGVERSQAEWSGAKRSCA